MKIKANTLSESKILIWFLVGIFVILNLIIASYQAIWLDETYTINTTSQKIGEVIRSSLQMEMQPPFYFVFLKIWRTISESIFWARILSVLIMGTSIYVFYKVISLFTSGRSLYFIVFLFALNPFSFWAAQEIRGYGLSIMFLLLQQYLLFKYYAIQEKTTLNSRIWLIIVSILSISTNFYLAFPLLVNFFLLILIKSRNSGRYLIDMVLPVFCSALYLFQMPWEQILYYQMTDHSQLSETIYDQPFANLFFYNSAHIVRKFNLFISGWERYYLPVLGEHNYHLIISSIVYIILIYRLLSNYKDILKGDHKKLIIYLILITSVLFLQYFIVKGDALILIHAYYLFPFIMIIIPLILFIRTDKITVVVFCLLAASYIIRDISVYSINQKSRSLVEVARFIQNHEMPDQHIAIYKNLTGHTFKEIYKGKNNLIYLPEPFDFSNSIDMHRYVIESEQEIDSLFAENKITGYAWIITDYGDLPFVGVNYNISLVNAYFDKNYKVLFDTIISDEVRLRKVLIENNSRLHE